MGLGKGRRKEWIWIGRFEGAGYDTSRRGAKDAIGSSDWKSRTGCDSHQLEGYPYLKLCNTR